MRAYLIDWADLEAVIGSKDEQLLKRLCSSDERWRQNTQVVQAIIEGGPLRSEQG
ncbi:hypothetical protein ACFWPX_08785 [Nocardia sp. NPDC058518]|uniref:hypothetical protein n=1 Tax=Nocardia sp. NPDC058518 TaxID=3346534 RepID=UPI003652B23D